MIIEYFSFYSNLDLEGKKKIGRGSFSLHASTRGSTACSLTIGMQSPFEASEPARRISTEAHLV